MRLNVIIHFRHLQYIFMNAFCCVKGICYFSLYCIVNLDMQFSFYVSDLNEYITAFMVIFTLKG